MAPSLSGFQATTMTIVGRVGLWPCNRKSDSILVVERASWTMENPLATSSLRSDELWLLLNWSWTSPKSGVFSPVPVKWDSGWSPKGHSCTTRAFLVINLCMSCDTSLSEHSFWQLRLTGLYEPLFCQRFSGSTLRIDWYWNQSNILSRGKVYVTLSNAIKIRVRVHTIYFSFVCKPFLPNNSCWISKKLWIGQRLEVSGLRISTIIVVNGAATVRSGWDAKKWAWLYLLVEFACLRPHRAVEFKAVFSIRPLRCISCTLRMQLVIFYEWCAQHIPYWVRLRMRFCATAAGFPYSETFLWLGIGAFAIWYPASELDGKNCVAMAVSSRQVSPYRQWHTLTCAA